MFLRVQFRCEIISAYEVIKALSNPIGAQTLSSVKYRCRAGMGRCQGGFCTQHIVRIMEEKVNTFSLVIVCCLGVILCAISFFPEAVIVEAVDGFVMIQWGEWFKSIGHRRKTV